MTIDKITDLSQNPSPKNQFRCPITRHSDIPQDGEVMRPIIFLLHKIVFKEKAMMQNKNKISHNETKYRYYNVNNKNKMPSSAFGHDVGLTNPSLETLHF